MKPTHPGWFGDKDIDAYRQLVRRYVPPRGIIVEVGTWMGKSALSISPFCREQGILLFCVDHWCGSAEHVARGEVPDDLFFQFLGAVRESLGRPILPLVMSSQDAARLFVRGRIRVHLVFLDASHDYNSVCDDIRAWRAVVASGGCLAGHDYRPGGPWTGVIQAVDSAFPRRTVGRAGSEIWEVEMP